MEKEIIPINIFFRWIWHFLGCSESKLYAMIDVSGMRQENEIDETIDLGGNFKVDITVINHKKKRF